MKTITAQTNLELKPGFDRKTFEEFLTAVCRKYDPHLSVLTRNYYWDILVNIPCYGIGKQVIMPNGEKIFEEYIFVAEAVAEPQFTWFDTLCDRLPWNRDYKNHIRERVKEEVPKTDVWVLCHDGLQKEAYRPLAENLAEQIREATGRGIDKYPLAPLRL